MDVDCLLSQLTEEPSCLDTLTHAELFAVAKLWRRLSYIGGSAIDQAVARSHAPIMDHGIPVDRCRHG